MREGSGEGESEREGGRERERAPHLSEKLQEVIDIRGTHGLGDVSLVLQMVLAGVRGVHLEPVKQSCPSSLTITLKHQLNVTKFPPNLEE